MNRSGQIVIQLFVYVDLDDEETGKPVAEYFGTTEGPKVRAHLDY